jgi:short-subunit dehydrogenase
LYNTAGFGLAG